MPFSSTYVTKMNFVSNFVIFNGGHFEKGSKNHVDHGRATGDISSLQKYIIS